MDWLWVLIVAIRGVSPSPSDQWASRLTELDEVRAHAFATADTDLLDEVYTRGSDARRSDAVTIGAYAVRGGRVAGAELRVLSCAVVRESANEVTLDVVDQLAAARVEWGDGTATALPRDRPSRRWVTIVRESDGWRIAATHMVSPRR